MAAGLTVAEAALEEAMARLGALLARQGAGARGPADLRLDGALSPGGATPELCETLEAAGPWGAAAPAPRFALSGVRISGLRVLAGRHLAFSATDGIGRVDGVAFAAFGAPLGDFLQAAAGGRPAHLAGRIELDDWNGRRRARLRLEDAAPADAP
jgi:single-stranded-DNA-specific exonuclease